MKIFEMIGINIEEALLITIGIFLLLIIILFIILITTKKKQKKLEEKYAAFMKTSEGESIEERILGRFNEIDQLNEMTNEIKEHLEKIDVTLLTVYQKAGIVKYDAFKEMGGKLSFVVVLLNQSNDGFMINSMHSREGCYTYVKEIIKGESSILLSAEEKIALEQAMNN